MRIRILILILKSSLNILGRSLMGGVSFDTWYLWLRGLGDFWIAVTTGDLRVCGVWSVMRSKHEKKGKNVRVLGSVTLGD